MTLRCELIGEVKALGVSWRVTFLPKEYRLE
jgi:hypothetical protein